MDLESGSVLCWTNQTNTLKDQVSPYKVSLIVVIEEYCKYDRQNQENGGDSGLSEKEERQMMILLLHLVQSADLELKELLQKLEAIATSSLVETITERLETISQDGVGGLMDLMLALPQTLFDADDESGREKKPLLDKPSVLGLFIRRMMLAFNKLTFNQVTKVQAQYRLYVQTWKQAMQNEGSMLDNTTFGEVSLDLINQTRDQGWEDGKDDTKAGSGTDPTQRHSQRQAEYFIAQQSSLLAHNEAEALPPKQLQEKISQVLASNAHMAEAHYLSYMNNLRVNEYCSAIESLFHYFDRQQVLSNTSQSASSSSKGKVEEEGHNRVFRYAALNLASVQFRFGHRAEAIAAVQEAIRMAQEYNDYVCLQHALGWLQRLGVQQTSMTAHLLDRLVTRSGELNLPYLTSLGVLSFAKHNALSTADPSSVFEFILKSDIVNCQHSLSDLMCTSYAQKAALWQMYGNREMSLLNSQLMLNFNTAKLGVYHNAEAECLGLCYLATLAAQQGEYNSALEILETTKDRFPQHCQNSPLWMQCEQDLLINRALYQGNLSMAQQAVSNLASVSKHEAKYYQCVLHKEKGETTLATDLCQTLLKECKNKDGKGLDKPELYARLLLLKSELVVSTENHTQSAEPLLDCLTLCKKHHYTHLAAIATLHLAFVQYRLGMPSKALNLLETVLIRILSHGTVYDKARAHYLWVRCTVSAAKGECQVDRLKVLSHCVQMLTDVITLFKRVDATFRIKDVLYYQARLYNELGYISERNKCAMAFRELDQTCPSWNAAAVCVL